MDTKRIERYFAIASQLFAGYTDIYPTLVRIMHDHGVITHLILYHSIKLF